MQNPGLASTPSGVLSGLSERAAIVIVAAGLLGLALLHGVWVTRGLDMPPDLDALRDIGFTQGLLDGNWWGDPAYDGGARYYPPLMSALAALAVRLADLRDLPGTWVSAGPWLNLLVPLV